MTYPSSTPRFPIHLWGCRNSGCGQWEAPAQDRTRRPELDQPPRQISPAVFSGPGRDIVGTFRLQVHLDCIPPGPALSKAPASDAASILHPSEVKASPDLVMPSRHVTFDVRSARCVAAQALTREVVHAEVRAPQKADQPAHPGQRSAWRRPPSRTIAHGRQRQQRSPQVLSPAVAIVLCRRLFVVVGRSLLEMATVEDIGDSHLSRTRHTPEGGRSVVDAFGQVSRIRGGAGVSYGS